MSTGTVSLVSHYLLVTRTTFHQLLKLLCLDLEKRNDTAAQAKVCATSAILVPGNHGLTLPGEVHSTMGLCKGRPPASCLVVLDVVNAPAVCSLNPLSASQMEIVHNGGASRHVALSAGNEDQSAGDSTSTARGDGSETKTLLVRVERD